MDQTDLHCEIDGCEKKHHARNLCGMHYRRLLVNGSPLIAKCRGNDEAVEFIRSLPRGKLECIIWPYRIRDDGYGEVRFEGRKTRASRLVTRIHHGEPIVDKLEAAHWCGNPGCVNPDHLRWATKQENEDDKKLHRALKRGMEK